MSRDLITLRDHARLKAEQADYDRPKVISSACRFADKWGFSHARCTPGAQACGCTCHDDDRTPLPTGPERVLWTQIADEIDRYLTREDGQQDLFQGGAA